MYRTVLFLLGLTLLILGLSAAVMPPTPPTTPTNCYVEQDVPTPGSWYPTWKLQGPLQGSDSCGMMVQVTDGVTYKWWDLSNPTIGQHCFDRGSICYTFTNGSYSWMSVTSSNGWYINRIQHLQLGTPKPPRAKKVTGKLMPGYAIYLPLVQCHDEFGACLHIDQKP